MLDSDHAMCYHIGIFMFLAVPSYKCPGFTDFEFRFLGLRFGAFYREPVFSRRDFGAPSSHFPCWGDFSPVQITVLGIFWLHLLLGFRAIFFFAAGVLRRFFAEFVGDVV